MKLSVMLVIGLLVSSFALADCTNFKGSCSVSQVVDESNDYDRNEVGLGISAPKIIGLGGDWYFGPEVRKNFNDADFDEDWGAYGIFTWNGTLINGQSAN